MNNKVILIVEKSLTGLAGYDYGKKIYEEQVRDNLDLSVKATIVFPDNIQRMASSFVQGFFEDIVNKIGVSGIEKNIILDVSSEKLRQSIINNLL